MQSNLDLENLKPLKAIIHGPPASGKTTLSKRLCQRYGAHYVSVRTMIDETLQELRDNIEKEKERQRLRGKTMSIKDPKDDDDEQTADEDDEEDPDEEDEAAGFIEDWEEQIQNITTLTAKSPNGKLPDDYVVRLMKDFLVKGACQTQGYVLDGYPKNIQQARELFGQAAEAKDRGEGPMLQAMGGEGGGGVGGGEEEGEGGGGGGAQQIGQMIGNASERLMPRFVVSLVADDDFLCQRVMKMPQREIEGTHYNEFDMLRRLEEFRIDNSDENSILKFFDESDIHPILINLKEEDSENERDFESIFEYITAIFGVPIPGFGLTPEEEDALRKLEMEQKKLREEGDRIERQLREEKAAKEYQDKMETWADTFEKLQLEEEKILAAQSEPLRFYLMKFVFPTLSKGLIEVARIKPDDPLDFLAEYLFRNNPEGKMFDPSYTQNGEKILESYEKTVGPILNKDNEMRSID